MRITNLLHRRVVLRPPQLLKEEGLIYIAYVSLLRFEIALNLIWHSLALETKKPASQTGCGFVAEREGFEPPDDSTPSAVFKTAAFNHSAISPNP
jgi:hypothetical protein